MGNPSEKERKSASKCEQVRTSVKKCEKVWKKCEKSVNGDVGRVGCWELCVEQAPKRVEKYEKRCVLGMCWGVEEMCWGAEEVWRCLGEWRLESRNE